MAQKQEREIYRVNDVVKKLDVSESTAYKIMRELNKKLKNAGFITIAGRIPKKYFDEKTYMA